MDPLAYVVEDSQTVNCHDLRGCVEGSVEANLAVLQFSGHLLLTSSGQKVQSYIILWFDSLQLL